MKESRPTDAFSLNDQDELLDHVYKEMFIVAYSIMKNKFDALDIVQEAWVTILRKFHCLRDKDKFVQWSKTIVYHTALNKIRKNKASERTENHYEKLVSAVAPSNALSFEERLLAKEIRDSMLQLDEETRKIIICKYYRGMKDREIAEMMNMPQGTVKARIHRGKERLRKILSDFFGIPGGNDT